MSMRHVPFGSLTVSFPDFSFDRRVCTPLAVSVSDRQKQGNNITLVA
jgi:hypothetical protein